MGSLGFGSGAGHFTGYAGDKEFSFVYVGRIFTVVRVVRNGMGEIFEWSFSILDFCVGRVHPEERRKEREAGLLDT
jgi:hypothetical protein